MFGLIKHHQLDRQNYDHFKKNYCGTCKAIGKLYGQKERLLLNNDIVFLSELLAELNNNPTDLNHITINSCFSLPKHADQIPAFLKYTASINILLGYHKVTDNIQDARFKWNIWRLLINLQQSNFKKAIKFLSGVHFSTDELERSIKKQFKLEEDKKSFDDLKKLLNYYSEPTGHITGEVFRHGAFIVNKPDLSSTLFSIGALYGQIVYLCDAVKDYKKDVKNNRFNLFRFDNKSSTIQIDPLIVQETYQYLSACVCQIQNSLALLPISHIKINLFIKRIWEGVDAIFYTHPSCSLKKKKKKHYFTRKFDRALNQARLISQTVNFDWLKRFSYPLIAAFLIVSFISVPNIIHASQPKHEEPDKCCECCGECCCQCGCDCAGAGCGC